MLVFSASHYHRLVFSAALGKTAERMVVGRHRTGWRVVPHCSTNDGQAALQLFSRTETELLQAPSNPPAAQGRGEQSGSREQRGVSREEERQAGSWVEKEPPWWCASLPAAGGAGSTNNYLTISDPGNKQSLASTTTTNEMTTTKSKTRKRTSKFAVIGVTHVWRPKT